MEKDWHREEDEERDEFVIYEFPGMDNFFKTPKSIAMPMSPTFFWEGDAGDFIRLDQSSSENSWILAGELSPDPNNYGLMTSCLDGRHGAANLLNARLPPSMRRYGSGRT